MAACTVIRWKTVDPEPLVNPNIMNFILFWYFVFKKKKSILDSQTYL